MELIGTAIKNIWDAIVAVIAAIWPMIRIAVSFVLWVVAAIIILPCVFIAAVIYPVWEKWGESF